MLEERGVALSSRTRRWGTLASLAHAGGGEIGAMPRVVARDLDPQDVASLVRRAVASGARFDAALLGLLGETGESETTIAALRVHAALRVPCSTDTRDAIVEVCRGRPAGAYAFGGRRRGSSLSPRGVRMVCERWGTTAAELRRAAKMQPRRTTT